MQGRDNLSIQVSADTSKLRADLAQAQAAVRSFGSELSKAAKLANETGDNTQVLKLAEQYETAAANSKKLNEQIKTTRTTVADVSPWKNAGAAVANFHGRLLDLGKSLATVVGNIVPHFKELAAIGAIGGAAGFVKMIEATAEWGHQLELNSKQLGIMPSELAAIGAAAAEAGIDMDRLVAGVSRFAVNLDGAADAHKKLMFDIAKDAFSTKKLIGGAAVDIFRGANVGHAVSGVAEQAGHVVGAKLGHAVTGVGSRFVQVLPEIGKFKEVTQDLFNVLSRESPEFTKLFSGNIETFRDGLKRAMDTSDAARIRIGDMLSKLGADVPAKTFGEALTREMPDFRDVFTKLGVGVLDPATGQVRKVTDALGDFLEKAKNLQPVEKLALVTKTFGRGFADLTKVMGEGRDGLFKFYDAMKAANIDTSAFDEEVAQANELWLALRKLDKSMAALRKALTLPFSQVFTPLAEGVEKILKQNKDAIKAFAISVANAVKPIAQDFGRLLQGKDPTTDFVKNFVVAKDAIIGTVNLMIGAFNLLSGALDYVARGINAVFPTDLSGRGLAIGAAVLYMVGAFNAVATAFVAANAAIALGITLWPLFTAVVTALGIAFRVAFLTNPIGIVLTAIAVAGLLIYENWATLGPMFKALWDGMAAFGAWVANEFGQFWAAPIEYIKGLWAGLTDWIKRQVDEIKSVASNAIPKAISGGDAQTAGGAVQHFAGGGRVPGSGSGDVVPSLLTPGEFVVRKAAVARYGAGLFHAMNAQRFADGGSVGTAGGADEIKKGLAFDIESLNSNNTMLNRAVDRLSFIVGLVTDNNNEISKMLQFVSSNLQSAVFASGGSVPGSGNGDTVPAWLTPGEFVVRKAAVAHYGSALFAALNNQRYALGGLVDSLHAPVRGFAEGGLATASGGTPVHLHLGGKSFALSGGADVVSSLVHEARSSQMRSAGTKPSWFGGTPGGR